MAKVKSKKFRIEKDFDLKRDAVLDRKGKRITQARVDKWVDEVFGPVGRPSLTAENVHSPQIRARVPEKLKAALDKEAKRRKTTSSEIIREALEKYLRTAS